MGRPLKAALLCAGLLAGSGCMPVCPFYRSDTVCSALMGGERGDRMRQNVEIATDGFPVIGRSTREEVLQRLGEPDEWSDDDRSFKYRWRMVVARYFCGNVSWDYRRTYFLRIQFDDRGVVKAFDRSSS